MVRQTSVFAHQGANQVAPGNTLPAFKAAIEMDVDGIELDVQCSKDDVLVVMHNTTVDETTDGSGKVAELTAAELRRLDAGSRFGPQFRGVEVPTLEDVFALVGGRCRINVEIKSWDRTGGREVEPLVDLIRAGNLYSQVIVSSFNPITLIKMRWVDRQVALGLLYQGQELPPHLREAWLSPIMRPEALHPHYELVDADYMTRAKEIPVAVNTWTVNDAPEARRLADLGVDVIITDAPDQIMAALQ